MSSRVGASGTVLPLPPQLDPRAPGPHRRPAVARRIGLGIMAAISIFALVAAGFAWFTYRDLDHGVTRYNFDPRKQTEAAKSALPDFDGTDQNLLVVGNDDRSNLTKQQIKELKVGSVGGLLTDTMMIIHVPADGSRATMISFPRDSYVEIPGYGMNKLNAAYKFGYDEAGGDLNAKRTAGAALLTRTISKLTGLTIDHFVQVTLLGFVTISNAVGGVDVNLCTDVNDTHAYNVSIGEDGGSGFIGHKGTQTIQGAKALSFVRQRHHLPHGDLDRTARQRYFLTQAFRKVVSAGTLLNPSRLSDLSDAIKQSVFVDDSFSIADLAQQVIRLDPNKINGKAIPYEYFDTVDVGSVEIIDPARVKRAVQRWVNPPAPSSAAPSSTPSSGQSASGSASGSAKSGGKKHKSCIN